MNFEIDFNKRLMYFNNDVEKKKKTNYLMFWTYFLILCKFKSNNVKMFN